MERGSGGSEVHTALHSEEWNSCPQVGLAAANEKNKSRNDVEPKRTQSQVCRDFSGRCEDGATPSSVTSAKRTIVPRDNFVKSEELPTDNTVCTFSFTKTPEKWDEVIFISHSPQVALTTTSSNPKVSGVEVSNGTAHAERRGEENTYESHNDYNNGRNNRSKRCSVSRHNSLDETVAQREKNAVGSPSGLVVFKRIPPHVVSSKVVPSTIIDTDSRKEGTKVASSSIHRQVFVKKSTEDDANCPSRGPAGSGGLKHSMTASEKGSTSAKGLSRRNLLPLRLESIDVSRFRRKSDAIQQWLNEVERETNQRAFSLIVRQPRSPVSNPVEK
ncbi:hypothetical protein MOQ_008516 [Trypanosoma cruzi marinkellei]|uniref:Uncharacterized protein n=1 Tax=Trypanosoma cruzi marinkellei TaxID=85056 RepID=K2MZD5_TRYCR|nr:hypothetical protein MOQ_008516 [Trypanosoma cruzi marinkellei]